MIFSKLIILYFSVLLVISCKHKNNQKPNYIESQIKENSENKLDTNKIKHLFAQNELTLFGENNDMPKDFTVSKEEDIYIVGQHFPQGYSDIDNNNKIACIVKLDKSKKVLWEKHFGTHNDDRLTEIKVRGDNIYVIGKAKIKNDYRYNIWLIKLNSEGEIIKEKKINIPIENLHLSLTKKKEIYVTSVYSGESSNDKGKPLILVLDENLNIKLKKMFEESGVYNFSAVNILDSCIYFGFVTNKGIVFKKLDSKGDLLLSKTFENFSNANISSLNVDDDRLFLSGRSANGVISIWNFNSNFKQLGTAQINLENYIDVEIEKIEINSSNKYILIGSTLTDKINGVEIHSDKKWKMESIRYFGLDYSVTELLKSSLINKKEIFRLGYSNYEAKSSTHNRWFFGWENIAK